MQGAHALLHLMVSLVSIAASRCHAGEFSRELRITIDTPLSQLEGVYRTVRLKVARAHRLSMGNQGELAAERANKAHPVPKTTILKG